MKNVFYLLILSLFSKHSFSQELPYILDTITVNSEKILIYSNKTWSYISQPYTDTTILAVDTTNLFVSNWTSNQIFAYLGEKQTGNKFEIELLDSNKFFALPFYGKIYRGYGRGHDGVDIGLKKGDSIKVAFNGKVRYATYNRGGYGNLIIVRHFNGLETYYAHLSKILVEPDQLVRAGDIIGLGGSTGRSLAHHLHFEVRYRDKPLDPFRFIDFEQKSIISGYKLIVTNNKSEPRLAGKFSYHKVRKGDSLLKIAKKYGTTIEELCRLNGISEKKPLKRGTKIRIA